MKLSIIVTGIVDLLKYLFPFLWKSSLKAAPVVAELPPCFVNFLFASFVISVILYGFCFCCVFTMVNEIFDPDLHKKLFPTKDRIQDELSAEWEKLFGQSVDDD